MNNNITFLLPIKDRFNFTKRFLKSFDHSNQIPIIISDGSAVKYFDHELDNLIKNNNKIKYIKYNYDKDYQTFLNKLYKSILLVETEYVLIACDDDFYFIDQILEGVRFLESNPDYAMFKSKVKNFKINSNFKNLGNFGIYGELELMGDNYKIYNELIEENSILDRSKRIQDCYPYEGIHRTSILKKALEITVNVNCFHHNIFIDILRYLIFFNGKVIFKDKYILAHQVNTPSSAGETHLNSFDKLKLKLSKRYSDCYSSIINEFNSNFFNEYSEQEKKKIINQIKANLNEEIQSFKNLKKNNKKIKISNNLIKILINSFLKKSNIIINEKNVYEVINNLNHRVNNT